MGVNTWMKFKASFYTSSEIKYIYEEYGIKAHVYVNIYIAILTEHLNSDGLLVTKIGKITKKFNPSSFAQEHSYMFVTEEDVNETLKVLLDLNLLDFNDDNDLYITNINQLVGNELTATKQSQKRTEYRELERIRKQNEKKLFEYRKEHNTSISKTGDSVTYMSPINEPIATPIGTQIGDNVTYQYNNNCQDKAISINDSKIDETGRNPYFSTVSEISSNTTNTENKEIMHDTIGDSVTDNVTLRYKDNKIIDIKEKINKKEIGDYFLDFWNKYPQSKRDSKHFEKAKIQFEYLCEIEHVDPNEIIKSLDGYLSCIESPTFNKKYICYPENYLLNDKYKDYLTVDNDSFTRKRKTNNFNEFELRNDYNFQQLEDILVN